MRLPDDLHVNQLVQLKSNPILSNCFLSLFGIHCPEGKVAGVFFRGQGFGVLMAEDFFDPVVEVKDPALDRVLDHKVLFCQFSTKVEVKLDCLWRCGIKSLVKFEDAYVR